MFDHEAHNTQHIQISVGQSLLDVLWAMFVNCQENKNNPPGLDQLFAAVNELKKEITTKMSALDDKITQLQADVTAETTVEQSAIALIQGIPKLITDAVTAALAQGATSAQLQSLTDLATTIEANSASLGAAVTAGTPTATT